MAHFIRFYCSYNIKVVEIAQAASSAKIKAPSTLIRYQTETELFCSGYGYRPHYNAENDHRKRSHSKTLSRVERFENDAF